MRRLLIVLPWIGLLVIWAVALAMAFTESPSKVVPARPRTYEELIDPIEELQPLTEDEFEQLKKYLREHPEKGREVKP